MFRERWEDPAPLTRNPVHWARDRLSGDDSRADPLPSQGPDPAPCGTASVQLLRTYPSRRPGYCFAPDGERSVARGYLKALPRARSLIYLEDQYLWSKPVARVLAAALRDNPGLRLIAVIPRFPDQDGKLSQPPNLIGRAQALKLLRAAGGDRVAVFGLENSHGTPIYVHAKVCVVDDTWATVGSDNFNRRSWTHDSELTCAVLDSQEGQAGFAGGLREALAREHLGGRQAGEAVAVTGMFEAFRRAAARLDAWHEGGQAGPRPAGQLRSYPDPELSAWTRAWATLPYHLIYDPDGRPLPMRLAGTF